MTFAWYAHLKELSHRPWLMAALVSWGIAFFEYMLQVPGNRIGYTVLSVAQLKILQEVITLSVFVPFAILYLKEPLKLDYLWAGSCILGAVFFIFRSRWVGACAVVRTDVRESGFAFFRMPLGFHVRPPANALARSR
ncbi:MAG: DMT family protein [Burkholderiaceae bacterium]|nr:DMT family protein [Burkholderiaceae bacterium]